MSNVVSCSCGKKLRLPEGTTARAIRCPGCQSVIRLDGPAAAPRPGAPASAPPAARSQDPAGPKSGAPPAPKPAAKAAVSTAPVHPPTASKPGPAAPKPAAPPAARSRVIQDPPNVWLYVTDPDLIAQAADAD